VVTNPIVIVEITSPSTEEYDRGDKLDHYKRIPSLREVVVPP
jgi:Uma2 family endonuclease